MQLESLGKREDDAATPHRLASQNGDAYSILLVRCGDGSVGHAKGGLSGCAAPRIG